MQIAQKISKLKIKARPAFKHCIAFATNWAANFGCYQTRIMPDIVSKLLRAAIRPEIYESLKPCLLLN